MTLVILGVGRLRERFYRDAADEYVKRLRRFGAVEEIELPDLPEPLALPVIQVQKDLPDPPALPAIRVQKDLSGLPEKPDPRAPQPPSPSEA